jgi:hypothetical protein
LDSGILPTSGKTDQKRGTQVSLDAQVGNDTPQEALYYANGWILQSGLRKQ